MTTLRLRALAPFIYIGLVASVASPAIQNIEGELAPEHRRFIEQEAVYIIAPRERDVFAELTTYEERARFIETFWERRDPNPATPENEFRDEHFRRFDYVNDWYGRGTYLDGWRTDQGRMFIILGEPRSIQKWEDENDIVPSELWFYSGSPKNGLPPNFYLLFFQENYVGEYELYNPVADGPEKLVRGATAFQADKAVAMQTLKLASPELAHASLTFDLAETVDFNNPSPSLAAGILIDRIQDSPHRAVRTDYVDAWLRYGNRVSAEYSFNFVPSRGAFTVLIGPELTPFVHYGIELDPANFSFESDEDGTRFYTTLDITVEVIGANETLVYAGDHEVFFELTASQMPHVQNKPIAYLADFPLLPGDYRVSVVLRNRVSQQYTVIERELSVPSFTVGHPVLSGIMLGHDIETLTANPTPGAMKAFALGDIRLSPVTDSLFSAGESAHLILQVLGAAPDQELRVTIGGAEAATRSLVIPMSDHPDGLVVETLDTSGLGGAQYTLDVELADGDGDVISKRSTPFLISPRTAIARPGVYRRSSFGAQIPGLLSLARGNQLLALGRFDEAVAELEKAVRPDNPNLAAAKWQLAAALLETREPVWAKKLLSSLEAEYPRQFEVIAGLGFANYQTGNFEDAALYLERAMSLRPPESGLLNTLGDTYDHLGRNDDARRSFERSLELNPNQPQIQKRLEQSSRS